MESLFKPPPGARKNPPSFSGPYDGVLLSGRVQNAPSLDYVEIFAGSPSSIPVLDLSDLETGPARQRSRSSSNKVDYSSVFGGFRNDDVAAPYEELFGSGSSSEEKKRVKPSSSSRSHAPKPGSVSRHSSEKTEVPSTDHTDQSVDGIQKHFNMSFNKTSQVNADISNGKTHIAELHAVPGFAYLVDSTQHVQKTEKIAVVPSLKREVSRTWSFSTEIGKVKSRSTHERPNIPDSKSCDLNGINSKPQCLNVPKPLDDVKGIKKSRVTEIASNREVSSEKIDQIPPTSFDDEDLLDENSAAVALKNAIDQAQEIITIAKMVMERKKRGGDEGRRPGSLFKVKDTKETGTELEEGFGYNMVKDDGANSEERKKKDGGEGRPKDRSRSLFKGKDMKETGTELEEGLGYNMEKDDEAKSESLDLINSSSVGRTFRSSSGPNGNFVIRGKDTVYAVPKDVETAQVLGETFNENTMSHKEMVIEKEKIEKATELEWSFSGISGGLPASLDHLMVDGENILENVATTEFSNEEMTSPGLIVTGKSRTLEPGNDQIRENIIFDSNEFDSQAQEMESEKGKFEHLAEVIQQKEGSEAVAELVESEVETSENLLNVEDCVDQSSEEDHETFYDSTGPESMADVISTSHQIVQETKILNEADVMSRIYEDNAFVQERNSFMETDEDDEKKSAEVEKLVNLKNLTSQICDYDDLSDDICKFPELLVIEEEELFGKEHVKACDLEAEHLSELNEDHVLIASKVQFDEGLVQNSKEGQPKVIPEFEELQTNVMGCTDSDFNLKKQDLTLVFDGRNKHGGLEEVETKANTHEDQAAETIHVEASDCSEVHQNEVYVPSVEIIDTIEEGRNEESDECKLHEVACESSTSIEAGDRSPNDVKELHGNGSIPESHACDSRDECHQETVDSIEIKNGTIPEVTQTFSAVDGDEEPTKSNHSEDDEMHEIEHLHQSSLEEIFAEIKLQNDFARLGEDDLIDESHTYEMPDEEDHDILKESRESEDIFSNPYLTKSLYSSLNRSGCEFVDVTQEPEEVQDSNEASSSEDHVEELKEEILNKNEGVYVAKISSNDRHDVDEQCSGIFTQDHTEHKEAERDQETEKPLETKQKMEANENFSESSTVEEKGNKENTQDFNAVETRQRVEAIKKEKEREKNRVAAERAIREARGRAFAEARERAERAAVERATAEVRQRVLAEAKERLEKSSTSTAKQTVEKVSNEAKLKAERAAVDRVLAEARERALEKVMSQKNKTQADKLSGERFTSGTSRGTQLKHSYSSSDLDNINRANTESALRNKARLERHQRIKERVAKALAEKNMRDLIAQKEQAERNRLSESLDAEIKRWAAGKEGNLRALLSTLQYILGPKSGWQAVSLTEIITTEAVKKAYRKATLYVHPDKLQQRGASIKQKYICEKIFDLLKAAWNKFNSEER